MTLVDDGARDLSRPDRGDRVRHAGHHRCLRGRRGRGRPGRRLRRPAGSQPAADADLRRRDRAVVAGRGVVADAGARVGDVRRGGGRTGHRRLRHDRGCGARDGAPAGGDLRAERVEPARLRRACTRNTSASTTCSVGAADPALKTLKRLRLEAIDARGRRRRRGSLAVASAVAATAQRSAGGRARPARSARCSRRTMRSRC